jgi:hypothetical protein
MKEVEELISCVAGMLTIDNRKFSRGPGRYMNCLNFS